MTSLTIIVNTVAAKTMLPPDTIKLVVREFFDTVWSHLRAREKVVLVGIGTFRLYEGISRRTGNRSIFPKFKVAGSIRTLFNEIPPLPEAPPEVPPMDKYGVKLDENKRLIAKLSGECPDCKAKLTTINPPLCPNCGTKPFEPGEEKKPSLGEALTEAGLPPDWNYEDK